MSKVDETAVQGLKAQVRASTWKRRCNLRRARTTFTTHWLWPRPSLAM